MNVARIPLRPVELLEDERSRADPAVAGVWELLEQVKDPEIPVVSVRELGILRRVSREGGALEVVITPTYSGCPAMHAIEQEIRAVLEAAGEGPVRVRTRLSPAWTTDWIGAGAAEALRAWGIAPPAPVDDDPLAPQPRVCCPRCGSAATRRVSEFGSTACKALYQCGDCGEPFDHFKSL